MIRGNMKKYIPYVIAFALFMETLDATIISTVIPKIAISLNTDPITLKIALTSYLLSLAIFIPISGWFADRFGTKNVFIAAISIFSLGSLTCGMALNLPLLVISRIIQGIGGALMMPVGRLILLRSFAKDELVKVTNYVTIPSLLGPAMGPVVGGIIASYVSWRWIFFVNIPFGLLGIFFATKVLSNLKNISNTKLDFVGFILFGIGLATLAFVFDSIGEQTLNAKILLKLAFFASILLTIYFIRSRHVQHPFIDLTIFKIRTFRITVLGSFFSRCGIGGMPFLLPLFFQLSLNKSPLYSGLMLLPFAMAMLIMKFFVKPTLKIFGFKKLLIMNTFLLGLSILNFCIVSPSMPTYLLVMLLFIHGLLTSLQFSCMNVLNYVDLNEQNVSKGTSIASAIQQLSMSFGIAISALLLRVLLGSYGDAFDINVQIFHKTFFVIGLLTLITTLIFLFLDKYDGREASGQRLRQS